MTASPRSGCGSFPSPSILPMAAPQRVAMNVLPQSQRNALRIVGVSFSTYHYEARRRDETALKMRIKEVSDTRVMHSPRTLTLLQ
jgi:hypothetical protein